MFKIEIECSGATWQEDFAAVAPRLYRIASGAARGRRDPSETVQVAVLHAMEWFRRRWVAGAVVRLWPGCHIRAAIQGRMWRAKESPRRSGKRRSVQADAPIPVQTGGADRRLTEYTPRDLVADAAALGSEHARVARAIMDGWALSTAAHALLRRGYYKTRRLAIDIARRIGAQ